MCQTFLICYPKYFHSLTLNVRFSQTSLLLVLKVKNYFAVRRKAERSWGIGLGNMLGYVLPSFTACVQLFLAACVCAFEVYYAGVHSIFHWQCWLHFVCCVFDFVCSL